MDFKLKKEALKWEQEFLNQQSINSVYFFVIYIKFMVFDINFDEVYLYIK